MRLAFLISLISCNVFLLCNTAHAEGEGDFEEGNIIAIYNNQEITDQSLEKIIISGSGKDPSANDREYRFWIKMLSLIKTSYLEGSGIRITEEIIEAEQQRLLKEAYGDKFLRMENFQDEVAEDLRIYAVLFAYNLNPSLGEMEYDKNLSKTVSLKKWNTYKKYYNSKNGLKKLKDSIDSRNENIANFEEFNKSIIQFYRSTARQSITESLLRDALSINRENYARLIREEMARVDFYTADYINRNIINDWVSEIAEEDDLYAVSPNVVFMKIDQMKKEEEDINPYDYEMWGTGVDTLVEASNPSDAYAVKDNKEAMRTMSDVYDNELNHLNDGTTSIVTKDGKLKSRGDILMPGEIDDDQGFNRSDLYYYGSILIVISVLGIFLRNRPKKKR